MSLSGVLEVDTERNPLCLNRSPDTLTTFSLDPGISTLFGPAPAGALSDLAERRRRFNDLREPDFAFNHVRNVRIMGRPVTAIYPFAPDSTVVRFALPRRSRRVRR